MPSGAAAIEMLLEAPELHGSETSSPRHFG
jgi:hypothetical protein